ncbi:hypothetical protein [Candidatus Ruthturnera calyptogenae]|uniref:hypothetical protein n=1 Tax=Candidatus Ruthturnera calyptogenae TaxID=386487 RepID=UPI001650A90D|nr:hypothetical protein [Candidatus Ruthturnera calyptogenae]
MNNKLILGEYASRHLSKILRFIQAQNLLLGSRALRTESTPLVKPLPICNYYGVVNTFKAF